MTNDPRKAIQNFLFSLIRTIVPAGATWVIGFITDGFGPIIDENTKMQIVMLLYGVAFGVYYFVVRLLETYVTPRFSWLLGDLRKGMTVPVYAEEQKTIVVPPSDELPPSNGD